MVNMEMNRTLAVAIAVLAVSAAGLGATFYYLEFPQPVDEASLRTYADPIVERMLQATNSANYTEFSMDFDTHLAAHINETYFAEICSTLHSAVGGYASKVFIRGERVVVEGCAKAYYNASFTGEPAGVTVMVAFSTGGGPAKVTEIRFDSPKLKAG